MKIIPVVIWYNPERLGQDKAVRNIQTYSNQFGKIIIVDNSDNDNQKYAALIPNVIYIFNFENKGIAKALNQGCRKAIELGYDWVMTMDQDSSWDTKEICSYVSHVKKLYLDDTKNISFSPNICSKHSVAGDIRRKLTPDRARGEYEILDRLITSGNILKLEIWEYLNGFNELLFIDEVDYEFCYRLKESGYNIIKITRPSMKHVVGENRKYFLPHVCQHGGERIYYIMRNMQYIRQKYPCFYKKYRYKQYIVRSILEKVIAFRFADIRFIYEGIKDARNNSYGKYRG
jgi:rhamnosyltransferase